MRRRTSLGSFLTDHDLSDAEPALREYGIATLSDIEGMSAADLVAMGLPSELAEKLPGVLATQLATERRESAEAAAAQLAAIQVAEAEPEHEQPISRVSGSYNNVWSKAPSRERAESASWRQGNAAEVVEEPPPPEPERAESADIATICGVCGLKIGTAEAVFALDTLFHAACFVCRYCGWPIEEDDPYVGRSGGAAHRQCHQIAMGEICAVCGKGIRARFMEMDGEKFHLQCFGGEPLRPPKPAEKHEAVANMLEKSMAEGPGEMVLKSEYIAGKLRSSD